MYLPIYPFTNLPISLIHLSTIIYLSTQLPIIQPSTHSCSHPSIKYAVLLPCFFDTLHVSKPQYAHSITLMCLRTKIALVEKPQIVAIFTDHPNYKTLSNLLQQSHTKIVQATMGKQQQQNMGSIQLKVLKAVWLILNIKYLLITSKMLLCVYWTSIPVSMDGWLNIITSGKNYLATNSIGRKSVKVHFPKSLNMAKMYKHVQASSRIKKIKKNTISTTQVIYVIHAILNWGETMISGSKKKLPSH